MMVFEVSCFTSQELGKLLVYFLSLEMILVEKHIYQKIV